MEHYTMNLTLKVWRQKNNKEAGHFETYKVENISSEMSFLEMFDVLNERLIAEGKILSLSIMIAGKVFVECVQCMSMVSRMVRGKQYSLPVAHACI